MRDRLGNRVNVKDVILHCDRNKLFLGLVVEEKPASISYVLLVEGSGTPFQFSAKSSAKIVRMEQTGDFCSIPLTDYRGRRENCTVGDAIKTAWDDYQSSKQVPPPGD